MSIELQLDGITVVYGKASALRAASVVALPGQVTAIAGPNGAGKSSLMLAAYGSVRSTGRVLLGGQDISRRSIRRRAKQIAIVPQGRQLFASMTVRENLKVMADLLDLPASTVEDALDRFPVLRERSKSLAGVLSGGEQQMLVVSRALMGRPPVLLLDETMTGLAPKIVAELSAVVRSLAADGVTVVISEPSIRSLHRIVDRGYVLIRGEIVAESGSGAELDHELERRMGFESDKGLREAAEHESHDEPTATADPSA